MRNSGIAAPFPQAGALPNSQPPAEGMDHRGVVLPSKTGDPDLFDYRPPQLIKRPTFPSFDAAALDLRKVGRSID